MVKFKKVLFGFLGVYVFAALSLAQAQDAPGADRSFPKIHSGNHIQEIYGQLNLTDEQKKQLEANKQQHRAKMESARQEIKVDRQALREELMQPRLDMSKINELHARIKDAMSQMEDNKLSSILAVRTILTPDQFAKFVNLMQQRKQEHGE